RHLAPGRGGAQHPEDAAEDGPMVVAWASGHGFLGWQQRLDPRPLSVSKFPPRQGQEDRWWRGCGPLPRMARDVAALGHSLVGSAPVRPAQQKGAPRGISGQSKREVAYLGRGQWDQLWRVCGPPLFPPASSAWRATV